MKIDSEINSNIEILLNELPFSEISKLKWECNCYDLGLSDDLPSQKKITQNRNTKSTHSSLFHSIGHKKLSELFYNIEKDKSPFIYIFWAKFPTKESKDIAIERYKSPKASGEKSPRKNPKNISDREGLLIPIYVGKSEGDLNGRLICHVDATMGKYSALKLKKYNPRAQIKLTLIRLDIKKDIIDYKFLSKSFCFTVEYFLAMKLKPAMGMHK